MQNESAAYTHAPIGKTMLKTAFSMLAGTLAMSGYNIVDTYFVGNLGQTPLAAIGFTFPIVMLFGCVFHGLGIGVMTTAAQALGSHKKNKAAVLVSSGILLISAVSVFLAIAGVLFSRSLFTLLGAKGETLLQVVAYMNIWFFGCFTASISMAGNNLLIAAGDSKSASAMMVAGLVVNAILDPLLIFNLGMGIRGAALATVIAQGLSAFGVMAILNRKHGLLKFNKLLPRRELAGAWGLMIKFAIPGTMGMLMMPLGSTIITWITARFGDVAVAATAAAGRLEMVAFVFPMALGISLLPMIGQNFGAKLYSRIRECRRFAMNFAFFFLMAMAIVYFFAAPFLVRQFSQDAEVQKLMIVCMHIIPWGFAGIEIHRFGGFFYTGCGRPAVAAYLNAFRILGLMIPFSFIALAFDSLSGLFYARLVADVIAGLVAYILSLRMVNALPDDGQPSPRLTGAKGGFLKYLTISRFKSMATAQAEIDGKSSTQ